MTIRTRLTLWYASILFIMAATIAGFAYHEFFVENKLPTSNNKEENEGFSEALQLCLFCGIPASVIGMCGGWWMMKKALAPINALTEAASRFDDRNLHQRLPRTGNGDELDRLTNVFNQMIARLENSFQQIREFNLHASHELKTPLTILSGELETSLRDSGLTEDQRDRILSQLEEIQRLAKIVDGLTLLTKAGTGQLQLKREPLNFSEMVQEAFEDAQILAQTDKIKVSLEQREEVHLVGDRHRLRQVLLNVFDNSVKYNQREGWVQIRLTKDERDPGKPISELIISNSGPGIPPEKITRVFEPFFRCELQGTSVEGCGLGLSICKVIIGSHSGELSLRSEPGVLTSLTIRIPLDL